MLKYRKATIEDIPELVRNRVDFIKEAHKLGPDSDIAGLEKALYEYFNETMGNDSFIAWVAIDQERIVATSGLVFYHVPPSIKNILGKVAYIMNMYTETSYRNQGIATALFEKIVAEARSRGYRRIALNATDKGKPLYIKYGFEDTGTEMVLNL